MKHANKLSLQVYQLKAATVHKLKPHSSMNATELYLLHTKVSWSVERITVTVLMCRYGMYQVLCVCICCFIKIIFYSLYVIDLAINYVQSCLSLQ